MAWMTLSAFLFCKLMATHLIKPYPPKSPKTPDPIQKQISQITELMTTEQVIIIADIFTVCPIKL
jgi:hypothetical protein